VKLFLHAMLPSLQRALVMDSDLYVQADVAELWDEMVNRFDRSNGAVWAYAREQQNVYLRAYNRTGVNGGVSMMDFGRMRDKAIGYDDVLRRSLSLIGSGCADHELRSMAPPYNCLWDTVDQTVVTRMAMEKPELLLWISCGWNRQTSLFWYGSSHRSGDHQIGEDETCRDPPRILHANFPSELKSAFSEFLPEPHIFAMRHNQALLRDALRQATPRQLCDDAMPLQVTHVCEAAAMIPMRNLEELSATRRASNRFSSPTLQRSSAAQEALLEPNLDA